MSGDKLGERLRRSLSVSRARFFTVAVGGSANHALLHELARAGSGRAFRIDEAEGATAEVLRLASAIKTPTITDLSVELGEGIDEPMLTQTGKVSRGEEVVLLARTHHPLPASATVKGRLGGKDFSRDYRIEIDAGVGTALVPRLWASEKVRRLLGAAESPEEHRGKVVELGLDYGLVTPFTSILALESEQAYQQQGVKRRRSTLRGVQLTALDPVKESEVLASLSPPSAVTLVGCESRSAPASMEASPPARAASKYEPPTQSEGQSAPEPMVPSALDEGKSLETKLDPASAAAAPGKAKTPTEAFDKEQRSGVQAATPLAAPTTADKPAAAAPPPPPPAPPAVDAAANKLAPAQPAILHPAPGSPAQLVEKKTEEAPLPCPSRPRWSASAATLRGGLSRSHRGLVEPAPPGRDVGRPHRALRQRAIELRALRLAGAGSAPRSDPGQGAHRRRRRGAAQPLRGRARDPEVRRSPDPPPERRSQGRRGGAAGALRRGAALA